MLQSSVNPAGVQANASNSYTPMFASAGRRTSADRQNLQTSHLTSHSLDLVLNNNTQFATHRHGTVNDGGYVSPSPSSRMFMPLYYHPQLSSMQEVLDVMTPFARQNGSFLVRNSFSRHGMLTASVIQMVTGRLILNDETASRLLKQLVLLQCVQFHNLSHDMGVKHFNITVTDGMFSVVNHQFNTLQELVAFYGTNDVPNLEQVHHIRLKFPIAPPSNTSSQPIILLPHPSTVTSNTSELPGVTGEQINQIRHGSLDDILSPGRQPSRVSAELSPSPSFGQPQRRSFLDTIRSLLPSRKSAPANERSSSDLDIASISTTESVSQMVHLTSKPAAPLPDCSISSKPAAPYPEAAVLPSDEAVAQSTNGGYYSSPRDVEQKLSNLLIVNLRHEEQCLDAYPNSDRCHCGLKFEDAELPRGWSMHLSTEPVTAGRIFFTAPDGQTSWRLPLDVSIDLDPEQQDRIRNVLAANDQRAAKRCNRMRPPVTSESQIETQHSLQLDTAAADRDIKATQPLYANSPLSNTPTTTTTTETTTQTRNYTLASPMNHHLSAASRECFV